MPIVPAKCEFEFFQTLWCRSLLLCHVLLLGATGKEVMLVRLLLENHKKRSKLDKLARDRTCHHNCNTDQGKLTRKVLTKAIKKYSTSGGKLKVTGKKEELRERCIAKW